MKKLIYLLPIMALFFSACNPVDDIYTAIDAQQQVITGDAVYTLTTDDYSSLGVNDGFSSVDEAKSLVPDFLTGLYPVWGKGSSVLVNYQMADGQSNLKAVSDYYNADSYQLKNTDYPGYSQNAFAFFPNEDPADYLNNLLSFLNPVEGQIELVKYNKYVSQPTTGIINYFERDFTDGTINGFEAVSVTGAQVWTGSSYGAKMSGYSSGTRYVNEDWLISPEIDLTNQTNLTFTVNQIINYANDLGLLNILISTDYDGLGDPSTATWDTVTLTNSPAGNSWTPVQSEDYDLTAYEGSTIHIAFKYESTDASTTNDASTWELKDFQVKTPGVEGTTSYEQVYYVYNGTDWVKAQGEYNLNAADYDSMGTASGEPGKYNNFSSSTAPGDYIPALLNMKYPFAQEEDELIVTYKYYNSGTKTRGNLYTFTNGEWVGNTPKLQFGHDGTNWVPDNTIKYTLVGADYDYISAQLTGNADFDNVSLSNLASYGDFDYNWSDNQLLYAMGILADHINPTAAEGQKYVFTYLLYDNGLNTRTMSIIKTGGVWVLNI